MWKCYELKYEAKSAVHIGYGSQLGIVSRTRYYMPGKTMWGAVTAVLSRRVMKSYDPALYRKVGKFVKNHLIFSYFYPMKDKNVFYPIYTEKGFGFGENKNSYIISKEQFEKEFVYSYVSTALDKSSKSAEDKSLHEFEILSAPEFIGYLFTDLEKNQNIEIEDMSIFVSEIEGKNIMIEIREKNVSVFDIIKNMHAGGERIYGFGKIELKNKKLLDRKNLYNSNMKVDLSNLTIYPRNRKYVALSPVVVKDKNGKECLDRFISLKGDMEPIVGREWSKKGAGQKISKVKICLTPGTKFESEREIKMGDYGLWKII